VEDIKKLFVHLDINYNMSLNILNSHIFNVIYALLIKSNLDGIVIVILTSVKIVSIHKKILIDS